jgi:uncharacterized protein YprB with RNaseH-like and TPR domain
LAKTGRIAVDLHEQLTALRQRIASASTAAAAPRADDPEPCVLPGREVTSAAGTHWETEVHFQVRHGSADLDQLPQLPQDLLGALSAGELPACPPETWAFLDTETTGLAGGSGTAAFLIGVGQITSQGFTVRQFLMRDFGEEPSLLQAVAQHLDSFQVLVTYNGRSYDQPLLETRYTLARTRHPFSRLPHLDLLYGARRLWKLRLDNCRLVTLENEILGFERQGDIPGDLIPYYYFDFLRHRDPARIRPILHHNALDIVSLGCLTAVIPVAFQDPTNLRTRHPQDLLGLARWLTAMERHQEALELLDLALRRGLPDALAFRALWESASIAKRVDLWETAILRWHELATCPNPHQLPAIEELAKYCEHQLKDHHQALLWCDQGLTLDGGPQWQRRANRLRAKASLQARLLEPDL